MDDYEKVQLRKTVEAVKEWALEKRKRLMESADLLTRLRDRHNDFVEVQTLSSEE